MDERTLDEWIDKLAIQEVIATYSDTASRGDWETFATLWAPDAVWEVGQPVGSRVEGAEAIIDVASGNVDDNDFLIQMAQTTVVRLGGDGTAWATTMIHALAHREGRHSVTNYGIYFDDLVKLDGQWKFSRRLLQPVYSEAETFTGTIPITRDELRRLV
ncbi:MAG TPA: nuclear transport factor 2 family protein [Acidimicrobiales bacterium]